MKTSEFVAFDEMGDSASGKTKLFSVRSGVSLGNVKWFSKWRRYCFFPNSGLVFDTDCLFTIAAFCEQQTRLHKGP